MNKRLRKRIRRCKGKSRVKKKTYDGFHRALLKWNRLFNKEIKIK